MRTKTGNDEETEWHAGITGLFLITPAVSVEIQGDRYDGG